MTVAEFGWGWWRVTWVCLGDERDARGRPLLRAEVGYRGPGRRGMTPDGGGYSAPAGSSFCTLAVLSTPLGQLRLAARELVAALERAWTPDRPWSRRVMEKWTWRTYSGETVRDGQSWRGGGEAQRLAERIAGRYGEVL